MSANQKQILIIEDEKPLAHALELKLQHEGYTTVVVHNGQDGLDAAAKTQFSVILLDLMMPVMDGFQLLEALQKSGNTAKVIVLSNLSQQEDEDRVLSLGAYKYFIKSDTPLAVIVEEVKKS